MSSAQALFAEWAAPQTQSYQYVEGGVPMFRFTVRSMSYHEWNMVRLSFKLPDPQKYTRWDADKEAKVHDSTLPAWKEALQRADDEIICLRLLRSLVKLEFWVVNDDGGKWQEVIIPGDTEDEQVKWLLGQRRKIVYAIQRVLEQDAVGEAQRIEGLAGSFRA